MNWLTDKTGIAIAFLLLGACLGCSASHEPQVGRTCWDQIGQKPVVVVAVHERCDTGGKLYLVESDGKRYTLPAFMLSREVTK